MQWKSDIILFEIEYIARDRDNLIGDTGMFKSSHGKNCLENEDPFMDSESTRDRFSKNMLSAAQ